MELFAAIALVLAQDAKPAVAGERPFNPRYEFLVRLRDFEDIWKLQRDGAARNRALADIDSAGDSCRSGDLQSASRSLDRAYWELCIDGFGSPDCDGLGLAPDHRLCDSIEQLLHVRVQTFYDPSDPRARNRLTGWFEDQRGLRLEADIADEGSGRFEFDLIGARPGDHATRMRFSRAFEVRERVMTISIVEKRDERLAALEKAIAALPEKAPRLERETASALLVLLKSLATGSTEETDYPGARLLAEAEDVVAAAANGKRWYGPQHAGEFFLALPTESTTTRARVLVPDGLSKESPAPLVVALHGRVFSEHTWFECYGDGEALRQCEKRKWLLVAPRLDPASSPSVASVVDAVAAAYPVDRSKVFLIGHSMGGGIGLAAVRSSPKSFRAFAAIGAGQALDDAAALKDLPIFFAAGDHDFARDGAEALHASLTAAGSTRATLKVYPNAEHWMTVADALPDVFAFFDAALQ